MAAQLKRKPVMRTGMTAAVWSTAGLSVAMVGVLLLFKWGPPQPSHEQGVHLALEDATPIGPNGKTVAEHNKEIAEQRILYARRSRLGLVLLFIGFALQLVGVWVGA